MLQAIRLCICTEPARLWTQVVLERFRAKSGLDKPLHVQYLVWIGNFLRGNLGYSFVSNQPVTVEIIVRLKLTVELMLGSLFLALLLAIPLGILYAVKRYSVIDNVFSTISLLGYCMPRFWVGVLLIFFFAVSLGWFPTSGVSTLGVEFTPLGSFIDHLRHPALPLFAATLAKIAYYFRMVRASMIHEKTRAVGEG